MMNLSEYQKRPDCMADYLPWTALIAPGTVLNKDGSFQRTAEFRGPDLESSTEEELVATCARLNNALRRFGSGWALQLWLLGIIYYVCAHTLCVFFAARDPQFMEVLIRHIKHKGYLA